MALVDVYQGSQVARSERRERGHKAGQIGHRAALALSLVAVDHR
jgi:hypothetical protein